MGINNITSYEDLLCDLQESNQSSVVAYLQPEAKQIYEIDLDTRTISVPQFLSVRYDHNAEVIYFKCNRFYNEVDLANTTCVIQYINADGDAGLYCVPYFDVDHMENNTPILLIPWMINGLATSTSGTITFSIKFYIIDTDENKYIYNLNTKPATGEILHGIDLAEEEIEKFELEYNAVEELQQTIQTTAGEAITYWYDI